MPEEYTNPLELFGVPKWFVREQLERGEEGLKAIQGLVKTAQRHMASRLYHPDTGATPDGAMADKLMVQVDLLGDLPSVEVFANDLLDTGSLYAEETKRIIARADSLQRDKLAALMGMLSAVDPCTVAGLDQPTELVLALPDLYDKLAVMVQQMFSLPVVNGGPGILAELRLPKGALGVSIMSMRALPEYLDGDWFGTVMRVKQDRTGVIEPSQDDLEEVQQRLVPTGSVSHVRLVGALPAEPVLELYGMRLEQSFTALASGGAASVGKVEPLTWQPVAKAEWLGFIKPQLEVGDLAVVATGEGGDIRLAIAGMRVADRPL